MDRDFAKRQLAAQLQARTQLIEADLLPAENVIDCGEVNELSLNTPLNLGAGEALLFVTDHRLILHRSGRSEFFPYGDIRGFRIKRAPRGVPRRGWFRELTLELEGGGISTMIGGRMFLSEVGRALRR